MSAPAQAPQSGIDSVYLNYFDVIDEAKTKALMTICTDIIAKQAPRSIYFLFSSGGGSVNAGITLYNFLHSLPVEIVMHNCGSIDSVATVVFLAGAKRYAAKHSSFLFHGVNWNFAAGSSLTYDQLSENLSRFRADENKIASIIVDRTDIGDSEIRDLFRQGEAKDLHFARDKNVIHEIRDPSIPKNAPIVSVNFS